MVDAINCANTDSRIWFRDKQKRITMSARKGFEKLSEKKAHNKETHPERGTKRYAQNEKIINQNPVLKKARDISQGFSPTSTISTGADVSQQYKDNYDKIDFKGVRSEKKGYRVKVNGVYQDEQDND